MNEETKKSKSKKAKPRNFISVKEASEYSGLDNQTIRKMFDLSQICGYKTPTGFRRIDVTSLEKMCHPDISDVKVDDSTKENFLYARVSTKKQMDDLSRQIEFLQRPEYIDYILIQDVGSGINFKRKGLARILDSCLQGNVGEVVIAHRDRLCRFAFELIETLITKAGGSIKVLDSDKDTSEQKELAEDLLSIIHIFNCRQMGKRSYNNKNRCKVQNTQDKDLPNEIPESEA